MVQATSFLSKKRENLELLKSSKANGYGEYSSQCTLYRRRSLGKLTPHKVQGKSVKQNEFHSVPKRSFLSPNPRRFIKTPLNTLPVFQSNPRYPRRGNINGDAPRTPKRQERAMDNWKNSGARRKAKLNQPCYRSRNVKILLPVRGSGQQDFEGLLWGQRTWVPRPTSNNKPKGPAEEEDVRGWLRKAQSY